MINVIDNDNLELSLERYSFAVQSITDYNLKPKDVISVSIVITTYNTNEKLLGCLDSLSRQTFKDFEVIIVDNGKNDRIQEDLKRYPVKYIKLKKNYFPCFGRNVGILFAKADIVLFIDDDAMVDEKCVQAHYEFYQKEDIYGLSGKAVAYKHPFFTHFAPHYDLGPVPKRVIIDLECICSFRKDILLKVNGFNPNVFGGEGPELCRRIMKAFKDGEDKIMYTPQAIIYHDYADSLPKFTRKTIRYGRRYGKEIFENGKPLRFLFKPMDLQNLFIPRVKYFFKLSREEKRFNVKKYFALLFLTLYMEWLAKICEVYEYLRQKKQAAH